MTWDRRTTEAPPWSVAEFRTYLDNLSGSRATFDKLWLDMRVALGADPYFCLSKIFPVATTSMHGCLKGQGMRMQACVPVIPAVTRALLRLKGINTCQLGLPAHEIYAFSLPISRANVSFPTFASRLEYSLLLISNDNFSSWRTSALFHACLFPSS